MNRIDMMETSDGIEKVSREICEMIYKEISCDDCPFKSNCYFGHNGVKDFLTMEVSE